MRECSWSETALGQPIAKFFVALAYVQCFTSVREGEIFLNCVFCCQEGAQAHGEHQRGIHTP
jgi:hypothetical protein